MRLRIADEEMGHLCGGIIRLRPTQPDAWQNEEELSGEQEGRLAGDCEVGDPQKKKCSEFEISSFIKARFR